tara:strand:- start:473 stop:661 length:189 start_codon:yes stop_codon:yes gene_type:complete
MSSNYITPQKMNDMFNEIMEDIQNSGLPIMKNCSDIQKKYILPNQFINLIQKNIKNKKNNKT